jgi:Xaa-Pro aminopeptidase
LNAQLRPIASPESAPVITAAEYARRRRRLMEMAGEDAILVIPAAPERIRSNDTHHPYRQDSDFWYLTGFAEPEAVLVLVPGRGAGQTLMFCRERDPERESWDGPRAGPEGVVERYGMDDAYPWSDMEEILPRLIEGRSRVFFHFGRDAEFDLKLIGWVKRVRAQLRGSSTSPHEFQEIGHLLHELRLYKSAAELAVMRHACAVGIEAHVAAIRATRPACFEYEIEAELLYRFRRHGAVPSYSPIVAAGDNACVLHYRNNDARIADGDLLLIDAGAEVQGYASDITRTFPANGSYSPAQRAIHDLVLEAQLAAIAVVKPGASWIAPHQAAVETLTDGLLRLGLLKGTLKQNLKDESYRRFYPHKTGHWLGLDVHDVGDYRIDNEFRMLEPSMVFTIEPGLYVRPDDKTVAPRWRGIGVRIEDDVVVTRSGCEVLSQALPKHSEELEALMAGG